jgi:hypothetical protein
MSTVQLRQQAKAVIDDLSADQLRVASEFLAFVKSRELDSATLELLSIPGFEASFARGNERHQNPTRQVLAQSSVRCINSSYAAGRLGPSGGWCRAALPVRQRH